jgi:Glycosyl hydrolase family 26
MTHPEHSRKARAAAACSIAVAGAITLSVAAPPVSATPPRVTHTLSAVAATAAHRAHANVCRKSRIDVPRCGILWGMYTPPVPAPGMWRAPYQPIEAAIGRHFDIVKRYVDWVHGDTFPNRADEDLAANGKRILEFSWTAGSFKTGAKVSYQSIANGDWDKSVILPEARRLRRLHHKVFIDFNHENDTTAQQGQGSPAQYAAAYRHIHRVMHKAGVRTVIWAWVTTGDVEHAKQIKASYPGRKYVDWVGYDPYNFSGCQGSNWRSPHQTFSPFYRWVHRQPGMKHKPLSLGEYASTLGPHTGSWYAHVARALKHLRRIKAVMQWSSGTSPSCDFRLTDSVAALRGFAKSSNAPYITGVKH